MNKLIKAVIVDDEMPARMLIREYLSAFPNIQVIAECTNGFEGVRQLQIEMPDLLFLDVQMPKLNGFEMLEVLDQVPVVIFSTAFDQFAIKAFEQNAVDYLLKPYSLDRFSQAVRKALDILAQQKGSTIDHNRMLASAIPEGQFLDRLVVKSGTKINVVPLSQVEYFEAEDDYVMIYTSDGRHMKQITMGYLEDHLDPNEFVRIHRSQMVRIDRIVQLEPYDKDTKIVVLKSGKKIRASKSGMKNLKEILGF